MPPGQPTGLEILVNRTVASIKAVVPLLDELHDGLAPPFVQAIAHTALALIAGLQTVKKNREQCARLSENIHSVMHAIAEVYLRTETPGSIPPATMNQVAKFTGTIHKIHAFVEAQLDKSRIKHFFRQSEMNALLEECRDGMRDAVDYFGLNSAANLVENIDDFQEQTRQMHKELLELMSTLSDASISHAGSSIYHNDSQTSSRSFSLLPSRPQIFYGRDSELAHIVQLLRHAPAARIAILGAGGMGKTSLARAALHDSSHADVLFISCESAVNSLDLVRLMDEYLDLKLGSDPRKGVLRTLATKPSCLLVLDNLETAWEPLDSRSGVEDLLSLLAEMPNLALLVTLRGNERPSGVRWTRPFLPPLGPLSAHAARRMFTDIADEGHDPQEIDQLLQFTDNMPLAIDLMAHLVAYEGCADILARLETERTALLSGGQDRRSSLDASIALSLSSPRMTSQPGAKDLLSLLAILPDGLSDVELAHSDLPIDNILACRTVLLSTALAYYDNSKKPKRLCSLVPIREYMQHFHPAPRPVVWSLQRHFHRLLEMYKTYEGSYEIPDIVSKINVNFSNIHNVLQRSASPDLTDLITCTYALGAFSLSDMYGALGNYYNWFTSNSALGVECFEKALMRAGEVGGELTCSDAGARLEFSLSDEAGGLAKLHTRLNAVRVEAMRSEGLGALKQTLALVETARDYLDSCGMAGDALKIQLRITEAEAYLQKSEYAEARRVHTQMVLEGEDSDSAFILMNLALIDVETGANTQDVLGRLEMVQNMLKNVAHFSGSRLTDMILASLRLRERQFDDAAMLFKECLRWGWTQCAHPDVTSYCLERMADVGRWRAEDFGWTSTTAFVYFAFAKKTKIMLALYKAICFMGDVFLAGDGEGDEETAESLFVVALGAFTYMDVHRSRGECMMRLGDIAWRRGDRERAAAYWRDAGPLFVRAQRMEDVGRIEERLGRCQ
ncbi:hypothetical protein FB45DRAFT_804863 [Roridomyces roridus]|uniref:AAA+ ATPase domain-containing protein n=1 Tax=Roridomyces roridus TaxID=1738132 RepID=A0AAD7B3V6_9AGAR|nr:hypothetical protein FB45DRAFT_804863 [Roridomyces roridus]